MSLTQITYLVFVVVVGLALIFDLGLMSRKNQEMSLKSAAWQTAFWVILSLLFSLFIGWESGQEQMTKYLSGYFMEWSLSVDNIFVFIILFNYFKISKGNHSRVLLFGILMAITFRIIFIAAGSSLVARYEWILYGFGAFLLYTGFKMFKSREDDSFDPESSKLLLFMKKYLRTTNQDPEGKYFVRINGKRHLTKLSLVVLMLGFIDVVFAVDSIPAVFSIIPDPNDKLLIYSSNIFAVLGLRSLFFLLQGAANKFDYLQHGIALVLIIIGGKMLLKDFFHVPAWAALMIILVSIGGSIMFSIFNSSNTSKS